MKNVIGWFKALNLKLMKSKKSEFLKKCMDFISNILKILYNNK
jgi:hypothetical protein